MNRSNLLLATLALCLSVGACGVDSSQRLTPSVADGSDLSLWTSEVQEALTSWQDALGEDCRYPLTLGVGGAPITLTPGDVTGMDGARARTTTGTDQLDVQSIVVRGGMGPAELHGVLLHELGHAIGLGHVQEDDSIMRAPSTVLAPSAADVVRARAALGC